MLRFGAEIFVLQFAIQTIKYQDIEIYNFVCLLFRCENCFLVLREELRLRVFENRELKKIFVPKREELTGERRKLHNNELNDKHCSPNSLWVFKERI
jgi:hypothetical protein